MRIMFVLSLFLVSLTSAIAEETAQATTHEDSSMQPDTHWRFFTDQVMGGQSAGQVTPGADAEQPYTRMTGSVSTANRGGFIQMRLDLPDPPPSNTEGVRLIVRGNDQRYFVHLRTSGTMLPWQYYQAGFEVTETWAEVRLPLESFVASGALMRRVPSASSLRSAAVVAYGRDHEAQIDVQALGFY